MKNFVTLNFVKEEVLAPKEILLRFSIFDLRFPTSHLPETYHG